MFDTMQVVVCGAAQSLFGAPDWPNMEGGTVLLVGLTSHDKDVHDVLLW